MTFYSLKGVSTGVPYSSLPRSTTFYSLKGVSRSKNNELIEKFYGILPSTP